MATPSKDGWFVPAENRIASPKFNKRVKPIKMIVVHTTIAPRETPDNRKRIERWLMNTSSTASTHFVILRNGVILQGVSTLDKAWHAGKSSWSRLGIASDVNAWSIGVDFDSLGRLTKKGGELFDAYGSPYKGDWIEHEGNFFEPFTVEQIDSFRILLPILANEYQIDEQDIVGHRDVSPGRKTDPELIFPWPIVLSAIDFGCTTRELANLVRYH